MTSHNVQKKRLISIREISTKTPYNYEQRKSTTTTTTNKKINKNKKIK